MSSSPHSAPSSLNVCQDLQSEREKASFNVAEMAALINGGQERLDRRRYIRSIVQNDPVFSNKNRYFLSRDETYTRGIEMVKRMHEIKDQYNIPSEDEYLLSSSITEPLPTMLHDTVFIPCLIGQGSDEQCKKWLPLALAKKIIGCYCQTEIGHGSNVAGLQTTATFIKETDEIEIHTPSLEATKWWVGCLGRTSTHAVVFANLIVEGKRLGIHCFLVQLRSLEDHSFMPGVQTGDIGPKGGTNANDNGWARFTHVRIPRSQMLNRFANLTREGEYTKPPHAKLSYKTMVHVRTNIVFIASMYLAKASTISIRYSAVRRQFSPAKGKPERQILDYTAQQYRLFPILAGAYVLRFTGIYMMGLFNRMEAGLLSGDVSLLAETHASSAGLKSLTTTITADAIEEARRCCGGHGYSLFSGLPTLFQDYLPMQTAEGDNYLLTQQTSRYLLKMLADPSQELPATLGYIQLARDPEALAAQKSTIKDLDGVKSIEFILEAYRHRAARLLGVLSQRIQRCLGEGIAPGEAWNQCLVEVYALSKAHCMLMIVYSSSVSIADTPKNLLPVTQRLASFFALYWMQKELGDFMFDGYLSSEQASLVSDGVHSLMAEIRPDAIALVDAFDFTDYDLNSAIGRFDGQAYPTLIEWAKNEPLNKKEVHHSYDSTLKSLIHAKL